MSEANQPSIDEEEFDDDFDDFNEPVMATVNEEEDDDDFGSFDDGEHVTDFTSQDVDIDSVIKFQNIDDFDGNLTTAIDKLFDLTIPEGDKQQEGQLLDERSGQIYQQLSKLPHLKPNNWLKSRIRHNLLIKLGIPVNLDEIVDDKRDTLAIPKTHQRRKSINEEDIIWEVEIPDLEQLNISNDEKDELINKTNEILSKIETDNLNNSSQSFMQQENEEELKNKLLQLRENHQQLIKVSSVWNHEFKECKKNFEIYESVVQTFIGYSQKLERDALLNNIKHLKSKSKKSLWR
ncbi:hypothetical protein CLIB1444_03S03510 [[Candida] jaroonii]|uniref:Uncharacterized protein n=1 Tax=[Candida] jaroonii TaxID=467808 RepID=A0ACA9Y5K8_9ASCO|nr:hypothetical protein CLIB1444_03S03510 [[Candida] jaroonii]